MTHTDASKLLDQLAIRCQHVGCKLPAEYCERIDSLTGTVYYYYCSKHIGN